MRRDVLRWSKQCQACAASKVARHTIPPVLPIPAPAERFAHVHVDVVGPFLSDQGKRYLLTMIDRTTRWAEAIPIENMTADTVLQTFLECWVSRFRIPLTVTSDRGAQFTSQLWHTTLQRLGIRVSITTAYHPQANGVVERFHRTLKERPLVRRSFEPIVDAFPTLGAARPSQCAEDGHGHLDGRDHLRHTPTRPGPVLPGRAIAPAIRRRPARPGQVQRCRLFSPIAGPAQVQGLAISSRKPSGQPSSCTCATTSWASRPWPPGTPAHLK